MLLSLSLKHFVIVDELHLDLQSGFTVLTGETGAGKSITLDALGLLMGDKASVELVRHGQKEAQLSALFDLSTLPHIQQSLQQQGLLGADETELSIRRTIDISGRSRNFINQQAVTVGQLKELGEQLIDIHGQNTHQSLNREATQRQLLDAFAHANDLAKSVREAFGAWQQAQQQYEQATTLAQQLLIEQQRLEWQINELCELASVAGEWEQLTQIQNSLAHSVELIETASWVEQVLNENEQNLLKTLYQCQQKLAPLADIHPDFAQSLEIMHSVEAELTEVTHNMRNVSRNIDSDPQELERIESRMQQLAAMAKKYQCQPEELPSKLEQLQQAIEQVQDSADTEKLQQLVESCWQSYLSLSKTLSEKRQKAAQQLSVQTTEQMQFLSMAGATFKVVLETADKPMASGLEHISYQVAMNQGSSLRPLSKVASGGELSRISLSLQVVMSQFTQVPVLVFDEVDTGVGGRVAQMVGQLLQQLGQRYQVLAVTHLPQVAACGEHHWQVKKEEVDGLTSSTIAVLNEQERVEEIARMLGGAEITATTREHAKEMLGLS